MVKSEQYRFLRVALNLQGTDAAFSENVALGDPVNGGA